MKKHLILSQLIPFLLIINIFFGCKKNKERGLPPSNIDYYKVWDNGAHNAFTDLTLFKDDFYLVFREASAHVSDDGIIKVLKSSDGINFSPVASFDDPNFDLRDPKIINIGDSVLYIQYGMANRGKKLMRNGIVWSEDGDHWKEKSIYSDKDSWWLWSVCAMDKELLSIGYNYYKNDNNNLYLSKKRGEYKALAKINTPIFASGEGSLAANTDTVFCAIRSAHSALSGFIGYATKKNLLDWKCAKLDPKLILGGPRLFFLPNGKLYLLTRSEQSAALQTSLFLVNRETFELSYILTLPSEGDNGYGGIAFDDRNLFISYYSTFDKKTQVLVARFPLSQFK